MPDIKCADIACKYHGDDDTCTADSIELSWHSVMTHWDGRQEFLRCKTREESGDAKRITNAMKHVIDMGYTWRKW